MKNNFVFFAFFAQKLIICKLKSVSEAGIRWDICYFYAGKEAV